MSPLPGPAPARRSGRRFSARCCLLLLLPVLLLPAAMAFAGSVSRESGGALSRLVQMVSEAGASEQQDFAWIALSEVIAAYEKVYLSSATEVPKEKKARDKLISWRHGTRIYISELRDLLARFAGSIELQTQTEGPPVIYIDGAPVVISGPEIGRANSLEKRIVDTYCALYDCGELFRSESRVPAAESLPGPGNWTLRNFGKASYTTPDGLIFNFSGISDRNEKQQVCEALAAELRSLVAGLREAMDAGYRIDWNSLEIQQLSGGRGHRVLFNDAGEYLRMALPALSQFAALSPGIVAWIKRRSIGGTPAEVEIFADRLRLEHGAVGPE
ncbi:MAG: hypothetical protein KDI74_01755 [Gammaproteobacteria bacterium]|nr:hypothetical protein [Gammaproteobacteria bacterium]